MQTFGKTVQTTEPYRRYWKSLMRRMHIRQFNTKCSQQYLSSYRVTHHNLKQIYKSYINYINHHNYRLFSGSVVSNKHRLLSYYSYCIPKPIHIKNKKYGKITPNFGYAGEDAFFTFKLNVSKLFFIGVADGVGSWKAKKATDAAKYAQELMLAGIKYLSSESFNDIYTDTNHKNIFNEKCHNLSHKIAHISSHTVKDMAIEGASTLC
eukprot:269301_1